MIRISFITRINGKLETTICQRQYIYLTSAINYAKIALNDYKVCSFIIHNHFKNTCTKFSKRSGIWTSKKC